MSKEQKMIEELEKIRALLTPKPEVAVTPPKGLWNEFKDFLNKFKVLGLAAAFIMGVYLGGLIQSLVKDLLLPVIGLAIPGLGDLATITSVVGEQTFGIGNFLVALITFIIVAFVIFIMVKVAKKMGMD